MPRLPQPGGDSGNWGDILNDFLSQTHKSDGTLKDDIVTASAIADNAVTAAQIADGTITPSQLATTVQTTLSKADSAYQKPSGGVPLSDIKRADLDNTYAPTTRTNTRPVGIGELIVNVKDAPFGATGDGATDDTAAIQAALDYAKNATSGTRVVFFPQGTYRVSATLYFDTGVSIRGQSWSSDYTYQKPSLLYATPSFTGGYILQQRQTPNADSGVQSWHWAAIEGIALRGQGATGAVGGIWPGSMGEASKIRNVTLKELTNGIYLQNDQASADIECISAFNNNIGVNIDGANSTVRLYGLSGDNNTSLVRIKGGISLHVTILGLKAENYDNASFGDPVIDVVDLDGGYVGIFGGWCDTNIANRNCLIRLTKTSATTNYPRIELMGVDGNVNYANLIDDQIATKKIPLHPDGLTRPHVQYNLDTLVEGQGSYRLGYGNQLKGRNSAGNYYTLMRARTDDSAAIYAASAGTKLVGTSGSNVVAWWDTAGTVLYHPASVQYGSTTISSSMAIAVGSPRYQLVSATSGAISLTLPSTSTPGLLWMVKKTDSSSNTVTITPGAGGMIDGVSTVVLSRQNAWIDVVSTAVSGVWQVANASLSSDTQQAISSSVAGRAASGANSDITTLSGLTTPLSIAQGGTGASTQNFVDMTTAQTIAGAKTFSSNTTIASLQVNGSITATNIGWNVATRTGNYTLTTGSPVYEYCNATSGAITLTLPSTTQAGITFTCKKIDSSSNTVTITPGAGGTIDGSSSVSLPSQYKFVTVTSTSVSGTWYVVGLN